MKREKSETEAVWDDLNERFISVFSRIGHFEFDSLLKKEKSDSAAKKASEWSHSMKLLIHDLQAVGEVVVWQRQVNRDIFQIEFDVEQAPARLAGYTERMKDYGPRLAAIAGDLRAGRLSSSEIQKVLNEVQSIRVTAENVSGSIGRTREYLGEGTALGKEMDRRIAKILEDWTQMKDRHPGVAPELSDSPARWVPLAKKHWENLGKAREAFDKAYGPFLEGKIFKDIPVFRDYEYKDLSRPAVSLEVELKTALRRLCRKKRARRRSAGRSNGTKSLPGRRWTGSGNCAVRSPRRSGVRSSSRMPGRQEESPGFGNSRSSWQGPRRIGGIPEGFGGGPADREEKHPEQLAVKKKLRISKNWSGKWPRRYEGSMKSTKKGGKASAWFRGLSR